MDNLRTELARAKGLGSAKSGSHHWWQQRFTGIILALLMVWLIFFIKATARQDLSSFMTIIQKPYNIVAMMIFVATSFYHSMLGMRVIIEDYVSCHTARMVLIILLQLFCLVTVISTTVALFYMMIL